MEIFYCYRCGSRVRAADFDAGAARVAARVACAACAPSSGVTPAPTPSTPSPPVAHRAAGPASVTPPSRRLLWFGSAGLAVLLGMIALLAVSVGGPTEAPPAGPVEEVPAPPAAAEPKLPAEHRPLEDARAYAREHPDDLDGLIQRFAKVAWEHDGSPIGDEARKEAAAVRAERRRRVDERLADLDRRLDPLRTASRFDEARSLLAAARSEPGPPDWALEIDRRLRALEDAAGPAPAPPPPPPPPSVSEAARAAWQSACRLAFLRDYAGAVRQIQAALDAAGEDVSRAELRDDLRVISAAGRVYDAGRAALAQKSPGSRLTLSRRAEDGKPESLEGVLQALHPDWLELRPSLSRIAEAVDFSDISAASWAGLAGADPRDVAIFCLFEGDAEAARRFAGAAPLPAKVRSLRPPPRALSVMAANERQARRLIVAADGDFGFTASRAHAVLAYRRLLEDYADTRVVAEHRARLRERAGAARELRLAARDLRASGTFRRSSWSSRRLSIPDCWTSAEDIDWRESLENFVELGFPALPRTPYRCWVYAGGCCMESYSFHFQASGYAAEDPDSGNLVAAEPGGDRAFLVKPKGFFRSRHAHHARNGVPKRPERWQWIEVPLAEFAEAGLKTVRLLTDQQGFSVACAIVSADREDPPKDEEAAEILALPPPAIPESGDPAEWLLYGPLPNRGFGRVDEPQYGFDFSDPEGWVPAGAELRPAGDGRAAVFDFAARWTSNENVVAFALIHVKSPEDGEATLLLGSDDGVEAWLNGESVHRLNRGRGMRLDEDRVDLRLRAGWNRLLIKVYQGKGGWGLGARLVDRRGRPMDGLRYDAWGDLPGLLR